MWLTPGRTRCASAVACQAVWCSSGAWAWRCRQVCVAQYAVRGCVVWSIRASMRAVPACFAVPTLSGCVPSIECAQLKSGHAGALGVACRCVCVDTSVVGRCIRCVTADTAAPLCRSNPALSLCSVPEAVNVQQFPGSSPAGASMCCMTASADIDNFRVGIRLISNLSTQLKRTVIHCTAKMFSTHRCPEWFAPPKFNFPTSCFIDKQNEAPRPLHIRHLHCSFVSILEARRTQPSFAVTPYHKPRTGC